MKLWRHLAALVALLNAVAASASVVYQWESVSGSETIAFAQGRLEITDEAWLSGGMSSQHYAEDPFDPTEALVKFEFAVYSPIPGSPLHIYAEQTPDQYFPYIGRWAFNLNFLSSGLAIGGLSVDSYIGDSSVTMGSGADGLWTIGIVAGPGAYCYTRNCSNGTGYWRKVENGRVPEPPALLLLGIGLVALISVRLGPTTVQLPLQRSERRLPTA